MALAYECWYINEYKYVIGYDSVNYTDGGEGSAIIGRYKNSDNPRARKIICLNTGDIFDCIKEAKECYKIHGTSNINKCCCGTFTYCGKLDNGERLVWRYYEDYINLTQIDIDDLIEMAQESKRQENHPNYGGVLSKRGIDHINSKKVFCKTTKERFDCISDAMRKYHIKGSSDIGRVCNGHRKFAGRHPTTNEKLIWEWVN